jgi:uncharacterized protein YjiS (DUF1127 family)
MSMDTIPGTLAAAQAAVRHPSGLVATLKRWWLAYVTWRIEQAAITQLCSMSDRALKDIGLTRADITGAVRGEVPRDRTFRRY